MYKLNNNHFTKLKQLIERDGSTCDGDNGRIIINGRDTKEYKFRHNFYFMLGDNLKNSSDSRDWGLLPESDIVGKPLFIYWSIDRNSTKMKQGILLNRIGTWIY